MIKVTVKVRELHTYKILKFMNFYYYLEKTV